MVDHHNLTGYSQIVEELDATGAVVATYHYGHDLISQSRLVVDETTGSSDWVDRLFVYDGGGSVRALTDLEGNITDTFSYDSFGNLLQPSSLFLPTSYLYRGERWDADLGQYYLRARFYDADLGRFHTLDEYEGRTGEPLSLHKYLYAHANPVTGWDPSGRMTLVETTVGVTIRSQKQTQGTMNTLRVYRTVRRGMCSASAVIATNAHHLVPVFMGENRALGKTVPLPVNFHREFHQLLHYMLRGAGFLGGNVARAEYEALFKSNPATRAAAHTVLVQACKIFDKACSSKIGFKITPLVKKQIKEGKWDF